LNAALADDYVEDVLGGSLSRAPVSNDVTHYGPRRPRDAAILYAENRLSAWAKWARDHRSSLGYPTIATLYKAMRRKLVQMKSGGDATLTARGAESHSFRPANVDDPGEAIAEVDTVVAALPRDLHEVIIADYFTYGPIEVRCKATRWRRARYSQLLECAKYSVFAALVSRTKPEEDGYAAR